MATKPKPKSPAKPAAKLRSTPAQAGARSTPAPVAAKLPLPLPTAPMAASSCACSTGGSCSCGKGSSCSCSTTCCGCLILGVFSKGRTWLNALLAFLTFFVFDMAWHGHLMAPQYMSTPDLWRPDMDPMFLFGAQLLSGVIFGGLFTLLKPKGWLNGARIGLLLGLMWVPATLTAYATQPIPAEIAQMWALGYLLAGILAGVVLSLLGRTCCGKCGGQCGTTCGCGPK